MIGGRLTHRAEVQRNVAAGTDDWGQPLPPDFQQLHAALPCFAWSTRSKELVDGAKTAQIEDLRIMFGLKADVAEGDELLSVTDRAGRVLIEGRLKIEGPVQHKHNHREASLQRIG